MNQLLLLLLLLAAVTASAQTQDTIRVCTWNLLNFTSTPDSAKVAATRAILRAVKADIFVAQEIVDRDGFSAFYNRVYFDFHDYDYGAVSRDGPDTDNGFFYDLGKFQGVRINTIHTKLRDIDDLILQMHTTGDTLHFISCHLKAGDTAADSLQRFEDAVLLRSYTDSISPTHLWLIAGDLNTYTSTEGAYQALTYLSRTKPGHAIDPIDSPGNWHSNTAFADIHTQSTRLREFDSGAVGGLDDRFDHILLGRRRMSDYYIPGSYTTFGNDGRHFNDSINAMPNMAVPDSIADALHMASDHLPVYLDLVFPGRVSGVREENSNVGPMDLSEDRKR